MLHTLSFIRTNRARHWVVILIGLLSLLSLGAGNGSVLSLSASGGSNFNETITINLSVRADGKINNSTFYFEMRAPDGTVVDTHSADAPRLEAGQTYAYSWQSNNSAYPVNGSYTVFFCWSPGNSRNCSIAQSSSGFYSVPTFGTLLSIVALVLLGVWLWTARHKLFGRQTTA